jgi:hypothetical protein
VAAGDLYIGGFYYTFGELYCYMYIVVIVVIEFLVLSEVYNDVIMINKWYYDILLTNTLYAMGYLVHREGLIGRCHIEREGLMGVCHRERGGLAVCYLALVEDVGPSVAEPSLYTEWYGQLWFVYSGLCKV